MSNTRVTIAKLLLVGDSGMDADVWWERLDASDRDGWLRHADRHLARLRAAGLLVEPSEWEWGVRRVGEGTRWVDPWGKPWVESVARSWAAQSSRETVVRRRIGVVEEPVE